MHYSFRDLDIDAGTFKALSNQGLTVAIHAASALLSWIISQHVILLHRVVVHSINEYAYTWNDGNSHRNAWQNYVFLARCTKHPASSMKSSVSEFVMVIYRVDVHLIWGAAML